MTRVDALRALRETIGNGSWPGDTANVFGSERAHYEAWLAFSGSINAARALQKAVRPGWLMDVSENLEGWLATLKEPVISDTDGSFVGRKFTAVSFECEAQARLLATIDALLAEAEKEGE